MDAMISYEQYIPALKKDATAELNIVHESELSNCFTECTVYKV